MFDNVGSKLKGFAVFFCWIGIIGSVIGGIVLISQGSEINNSYYSRGEGTGLIVSGLLTIVLGSLFSWAGSLGLYGFGQLIENSDACAKDLKEQKKTVGDIRNLAEQWKKEAGESPAPARTAEKQNGASPAPAEKPKTDAGENREKDESAEEDTLERDRFGWELADGGRFVICPDCGSRFSVDYMKYHNACKECGRVRE